jgi:hypothetical protein
MLNGTNNRVLGSAYTLITIYTNETQTNEKRMNDTRKRYEISVNLNDPGYVYEQI